MELITVYNHIGLIEQGLYSFGVEQVYVYFGSLFYMEPMTTEEVGQMLGGN